MLFKLSTKEKFHVITLTNTVLTANMTESFMALLDLASQTPVKNVLLNLREARQLELEMARALLRCQELAYENSRSLVICELHPDVEAYLDEQGILELLNATPTESEGADIIQMEEIEREMLGEEE